MVRTKDIFLRSDGLLVKLLIVRRSRLETEDFGAKIFHHLPG